MRRGPVAELWSRPPAAVGLSAVGLLAYDWRQALSSVASYYDIADEIVLGLDKRRISWSRLPFAFDKAACLAALKRRDPLKKIRVIEGDFHALPAPMLNETAERNTLAAACRPGNWVLQIDADEIMMNPADFAAWLRGYRWKRQVLAHWISVFKVVGSTALVIDTDSHWIPVGTRHPRYIEARNTREWAVKSPLDLLHFSWGRSDAQLQAKLKHWGHSQDFDTAALLKLWRRVNLRNYAEFKNFHPLDGPLWPALKTVPLKGLLR
jgi:predicted DNA-binding WGR domain protein